MNIGPEIYWRSPLALEKIDFKVAQSTPPRFLKTNLISFYYEKKDIRHRIYLSFAQNI